MRDLDIPPPYPNSNINIKNQKELLLLMYGYVREYCKHKLIPQEIIGLFVKWYYVYNHAITYEQALDLLLNYDCCVGVYDFALKRWRAAYYFAHFEATKRITIRFHVLRYEELASYVQFHTIKNFPVNYLVYDVSSFRTTERVLKNMSGVPHENIKKWMERQYKRKMRQTIQVPPITSTTIHDLRFETTLKYTQELRELLLEGFTDKTEILIALVEAKGNVEEAMIKLEEKM